jgi:outer membrane protein assembly factor BamB
MLLPLISAPTRRLGAIALFGLLAACGGDGNPVETPKPAPETNSVQVTGPSAGMRVGQTMQLSATARDAAGNAIAGRTFAWTSSSEAVASVSPAGLVTSAAPGSVTIRATADGKTGEVTLTITPRPVGAVTVSPQSASIVVGGTQQLAAAVLDTAGGALADRPVTWMSSDPSVATVAANGMVSAVRAGGPVTITATAEGKSGTAAITVTPVPVATVALEPGSATIQVGATEQFRVVARDAAGNVLAGRGATLVSSNAAVATVDESGVVRGISAGTSILTATSEGKTASATITVVPVPIATLVFEPASASVSVDGTAQLRVVARDAAGNVLIGRPVTLASSNAAVATVSGAGVVTGVSVGSAQITATAEGKTATATVTVVPPPPLTRVWESAPGGIAGPAAVHGGRFYAVDQNVGRLDALDANTGAVLWRVSLGGSAYSTYPVVDRLGNVYVGGPDHILRSLTPSGAVRWQVNVGTETRMAVSGDTLYATTSAGVAAYTLGGTQIWQSPNNGGHLLVYAGRLYAVGGGVAAFDRSTGALLWRFNPATEAIFASGAVGSDGTVYIGSLDRKVYAISAAGTLRWSVDAGEIRASPVESNGVVYVGSVGRRLLALDAASGAVRWDLAVPFDVNASPAVASDGSVYVVSDRVYRVSSAGAIVSSAVADSRSYLTIDASGFVYLSGTTYTKLYGSGAPAPGWSQFQGDERHSGTR